MQLKMLVILSVHATAAVQSLSCKLTTHKLMQHSTALQPDPQLLAQNPVAALTFNAVSSQVAGTSFSITVTAKVML